MENENELLEEETEEAEAAPAATEDSDGGHSGANDETEFTDTEDEDTAEKDGKDAGKEAGTESGSAGKSEPKAREADGRSADNARRRREAQQQKKLAEARTAAIIEAMDGINPYTGEKMKDAADVEQYLLQKKIKSEGGDPVADYPTRKTAADREERAKRDAEEQEKQWVREDAADFARRYPGVDLQKLTQDEDFADYASGKLTDEQGHLRKVSIGDVYEKYLAHTKRVQEAAVKKAAQNAANSKAAAGSVGSGAEPETMTKADFRRMSYDQRVSLKEKNPELYKKMAR